MLAGAALGRSIKSKPETAAAKSSRVRTGFRKHRALRLAMSASLIKTI
jgi:hypothetical protein